MGEGRINNLFDRHIVTAGEAAGTGLFGVYQSQTRWSWMANLVINDEREDWELLELEFYHSTAAGLDYHGKVLNLIALPPMGQTIHFLPMSRRCQYAGNRVTLERPTYVNNGVAVLAVSPVLIAGDILTVTGLYRVVRNER